MNVLAVSTNSGDPGPYIAAETAAIGDLMQTGVIKWMLLKADYSGAVLLLNVPDEITAQTTVDALPIAAHGLTTFTLTPLLDPPEPPPGA